MIMFIIILWKSFKGCLIKQIETGLNWKQSSLIIMEENKELNKEIGLRYGDVISLRISGTPFYLG